jgi:hypothetical protein
MGITEHAAPPSPGVIPEKGGRQGIGAMLIAINLYEMLMGM